MNEEIRETVKEFKDSNSKSINFLESELRKIRTGKASPDMLNGVMVDYYGSMTDLNQVANIGTLDGRTLTVQPWEKSILSECAKAIINANLGLAPQDNGEMLIINIPMLTEERRKELAKIAKSEGEHAKVSIRNNRKDAMDYIKELKNDGLSEDEAKVAESEIQEVTDSYVKQIDELIDLKEKDIMTI
ncbi:ribosome recycling factor [Brumimicrobium salinarum]|uniref:Ribosome-recycling factor n=1 Tax=Brumimicrobium salinarum TaxID=2058658 RepID=A0A2I0R2Q9_9FLAO|nr:ribosome recycling factor [Brumimicrobium salinarum]PKR80874.1 ribosome recycling factor [Brumimicrobium salinarum]